MINNIIDPVTGGGSVNRTIQVAEAIVKYYRTECVILSTDKGLDKNIELQKDTLKIELLPCLNERFSIPYFSWRRINDLVSEADIIHLMSHWTLINAVICLFAKFQKKPYTFCAAGTLHNFGRYTLIKRIYNFIVGKWIIKNASRCIAITELEGKDFSEFGVAEKMINIIPNGVDGDEFFPNYDASNIFRKRFSLKDISYILYMGRLHIIKGPDLLLKAYLKLLGDFPELHLVFAGPDAGFGNQLIEDVQKYSIENKVHFLGYIRGDDKVGAYTGAKLLAVPSRREAMSIVALEAGACGTPVILTTVCGFDEVKNVGCKVVQPLPDELYSGMHSMFSSSNALEAVGKNLRSLILQKYTWKKTAEKYLSIADSICQ